MIKTSEELASYHAALNLPRWLIRSYDNQIEKWLSCNGIEWTVSRMKTIYTDFVRYRAGQPPVGEWYRKNRKGLPSGFWSYLFRLALSSKKMRFSVSVLLRSYTRFISKDVTEAQKKKFLSGVQSEPTVIPDDLIEGVIQGAFDVGVNVGKPNRPSFLSYQPSPGKRVPDCYGKTHPEETHWHYQWETLDNTHTGKWLLAKYPSIWKDVFNHIHRYRSGNDIFSITGIDAVGKIGLIQEPGFKLRAVANPNRCYQVALKPLGDVIYDTLKQLPWDCTFDQSRAFPVIQNRLKYRAFVHCVDLTGATDYFPLSLQLEVLEHLFPRYHDDICLFEDLSRSPWIFGDTTIRWTKGQPLGLYPSFGSFALTHGLLLYYLNNYRHNDEFFVLGDDVVILNNELAMKYKDTLEILQCPISESKSITSNDMAEFGGKLIFADYVEPQLKWRQLSDDNFVDVVRLLGKKAMRLLRPQQRKVVKAIWDIPDFVGGLGFNPDGIPLEKRYQKYLELFGEDVGTFLMSYDRKFNQVFNTQLEYPNRSKVRNYWDQGILPDLDQKSAQLISKYLPLFAKMYGIMGTNLYSVVPNKDVLPIDGLVTKRKTLLAVLQSKLGFS